MFLVRISITKRAGGRSFLLFVISYRMLSLHIITFLQELVGQILVKRNIRYWLNTSLFNFDTHKGLTVKNYIILVCTQRQWALQVTPFGLSFALKIVAHKKWEKKRGRAKKWSGRGRETCLFFTWPKIYNSWMHVDIK